MRIPWALDAERHPEPIPDAKRHPEFVLAAKRQPDLVYRVPEPKRNYVTVQNPPFYPNNQEQK